MAEKTEAPTPRRLSDARADGQVAKSQELGAAAAMLIGVWTLQAVGGKLIGEMRNLVIISMTEITVETVSGPWLRGHLFNAIMYVLPSLAVLLGVLMLTGVTASVGQTGLLWSQKRLRFDFNRVNPFTNLKRLFSSHGLVELVKAMAKLLIVGWVAYSFLRNRYLDVLTLGQTDLLSAVSSLAELAVSLAIRVGSAYLLLALVDYAYQRWQLYKTLRMSKEEIKEDMKRSEGDPFIRARIRGQQRRMARMRMMQNVKKADVIITNPTHLAVAVQYDGQKMGAPRVVAKGADQIAFKIIELARKHSIPVVQNIPVARALYKAVEIDREIPPELYVALAEVLAHVYRLRGRSYRPAAAR